MFSITATGPKNKQNKKIHFFGCWPFNMEHKEKPMDVTLVRDCSPGEPDPALLISAVLRRSLSRQCHWPGRLTYEGQGGSNGKDALLSFIERATVSHGNSRALSLIFWLIPRYLCEILSKITNGHFHRNVKIT